MAITIYCDEQGCPMNFHKERDNQGGMSLAWASYLAKQNGWEVSGKRALCPTHRVRPKGPSDG